MGRGGPPRIRSADRAAAAGMSIGGKWWVRPLPSEGDEKSGSDMSPRAPRLERRGDLNALHRDRSTPDNLRAIVGQAAEDHEEVACEVRLAANRGSGDLQQLRAEIDRGLRAGQFLGYYESRGWAHHVQPIIEEIRGAVSSSPSAELVVLIERAIGRVVKVILHADDSDGPIGDVARELLDLHAEACDTGVADAINLALWMVKFRLRRPGFLEPDLVRYAEALGEMGLAAFRRDVQQRRKTGADSFALKYAEERLCRCLTVTRRTTPASSAVTLPHRTNSFGSPRPWRNLVATTTSYLGRSAGLLRPADGRSPSCTTWRLVCTAVVATRGRCCSCARSSTGGFPRPLLTTFSAVPPRAAVHGSMNARTRDRCWPSAISAGWSTFSLRTVSGTRPGRLPWIIQGGTQASAG